MKKANPFLLGILLSIFIPIIKVDAISLNYNVNQNENILEAKISIDSNISSLKAIEGVINFNLDSFEYLNVEKDGDSVFEKWGIEPYLNESGGLFFNGILDPNLDGSELFSIFFEQKENNNNLELSISSGAALTKDNELSEINSINEIDKFSLFNISSSTHPDENAWYSNKNVKLYWQLPEEAEKVKLLIDNKPDSYPSVDYNDPIYEKEVELDDGIWYFHIRCFLNNKWSPVEHRKIMIDTTDPVSFDVSIENGLISLNAEDELSLIDFYEIEIPCLNAKYYTSESTFNLLTIKRGKYNIKVRAYDKASNYKEKDILVDIKEINPPHFSEVILGKNELFISGYVDDPNSKVYAAILGGESEIEKISNVSQDGKFVYAIDKLDPGLYSLYLMTIGEDGLSTKNKKAILIIDKKEFSNLMAKILVFSGVAILIILTFYIFLNKEKKDKKKKVKKIHKKNNKKNNKNKLYDI